MLCHCANEKSIVLSKVMIITLNNYQADIIFFWVRGKKMIPFPVSCAQSSVKNLSACGGLKFIIHFPASSCLENFSACGRLNFFNIGNTLKFQKFHFGGWRQKKSSFCHQVSTMKCCKSATVVFANLYYELICLSLPQIFPPKFDHHPIFGVHAYLWFKYVKVEEAFVQLGVDFF